MVVLRKLRETYAFLTAPAPMREFEDFWEERGDVGVLRERWRTAIDVIPDGASVLDVGSGSGEFLTFLRRARPAVRAAGCDSDPTAVTLIEARGFSAFLLDPTTEPLPGRYDVVTCFETLEHIPDAETALQRLGAACDGFLVVSVPNVGYWKGRLRLLCGRFPVTNITFHIREHLRFWTERDFREWTDRLGFRVVRVSGQYDGGRLQQRYPGLLSAGLVYVLERR